MTDYEFAQVYVERAQRIRVENGEHGQECECGFCKVERLARRRMEEMPDHVRNQKNWVYLMREKLGRI
jgi:hypothetical protein